MGHPALWQAEQSWVAEQLSARGWRLPASKPDETFAGSGVELAVRLFECRGYEFILQSFGLCSIMRLSAHLGLGVAKRCARRHGWRLQLAQTGLWLATTQFAVCWEAGEGQDFR